MDKQYDIADLINDTLELVIPNDENLKNLNSEELFKEVCPKVGIVNLEGEEAVNAIRKTMNDDFIGQRFIALTALREGITLDGKIRESRKLSYFLSRCFLLTRVVFVTGSIAMGFIRSIPFEAMNRIYFAQPHLTKHDFLDGNNQWCIVTLDHDGDGSDEKNVPEDVRNNQARINEAFKEIIDESTSEYLQQLLCFWTGQSFMPDLIIHKDYKLCIEFNLEEDLHAESLPGSHTCTNTIKLPYNAYGGDKMAFRSKLDTAMKLSEGAFHIA
jgi:hypothetical protein